MNIDALIGLGVGFIFGSLAGTAITCLAIMGGRRDE